MLTQLKGFPGLAPRATVDRNESPLRPETPVMNNESAFKNYRAYSRIIEMMSFMERIHELTPEDVKATADEICDLPSKTEEEISMEEVLFWAGVATGMEACQHIQAGLLDEEIGEKLMAHASLFAYSTQNAVVDLTLQELEPAHNQSGKK